MRGISNVITAVFVLAVILVAAYQAIAAYIQYTAKITDATKEFVRRTYMSTLVEYNAATCSTDNNRMEVQYIGKIPEYGVRFICYDPVDPPNTMCVPTYAGTSSRSAQYVDKQFPGTLDLNLSVCPTLISACATERIRCFAVGSYATRVITVSG